MFLDASNKILSALMLEGKTTTEMSCVVSFEDQTVQQLSITPQVFEILTAGVAAFTLLPAPKDNVNRVIRDIHIYNADTVVHTIVVFIKVDATPFGLLSCKLAVGDTLQWNIATGWTLLSHH